MKTRRNKIKLTLQILSVSAIALAGYSCSQSLANETIQEKENAIPVKVTEVTSEEIAIPIHVSGNIAASQESRLSFKTGGIIKSINVNEGDKVKQGDILAQLDLKEINQQVIQANVALDKAKRDFSRVENLYQDTVSTLEQLQNAISAVEIAFTNLNIAEYNLQFSSIHAPCDGIILKKFMEENEIAGTGMPIFYFASSEDSWKMTVSVTDKNIVKLANNDKAKIVTDAYPDKAIAASVSSIANAPEPTTGLYEVELTIDNTELNLKPGFFARGNIFPKQTISCQKLPIDAIQEGLGNTITYLIYDEHNGTAIHAESEVLYLNNNFVYIQKNRLISRFKVISSAPRETKHLDKVTLALK